MPQYSTCSVCKREFERKTNTSGRFCSAACYHAGGHRRTLTPEDRLWARTDRSGGPDACWLWQGPLSKAGRGLVYVNGRNEMVHRYAWTLAHGPIPEGMCVCHSCDVTNCVNPKHLWLGTHLENMQDRDRKGRVQHVRGEAKHNAKLTEEAVRDIRLRYALGGTRMTDLATEYGISVGAIEGIVTYRSWRRGYE